MESSANSPRRSSRDSSSSSSSSEFEFWMVGKEPSIPQPHLLTADELFVDGVLLPLHLLPLCHPNPNSTIQLPSEPEPETPQPPQDSSTSPPSTSSKRWKDILRAGERKLSEKVRKKERREGAGNAAELNINIWPFSRSRSAGNTGTGTGNRARVMLARRKASSTPCSRSNSSGESSKPASTATAAAATTTTTKRRWAPNPGLVRFNGGIHLGRISPVRQLWRNCKPPEPEKKTHGSDGGDVKKGVGNGGEGKDVVAGHRSAGSNVRLLDLRTIFSKKML